MHSFKTVEWVVSGSDRLVLPDGEGEMTGRTFASGARLVTSQLEVREPTAIVFPAEIGRQIVSVQYFLSGEASIELGDGSAAYWMQDGASVIRADSPGFVLRVTPGQTLRHVCVCVYRETIDDMLSGVRSALFGKLLEAERMVDMAVEVPADPGIRSTASELYRVKDQKGIGAIKAEGLSLAFLSEVLGRYAALTDNDSRRSAVEAWQTRSALAIRAVLDDDPRHHFAEGELLERFQMGDGMARRVFQSEFGVSMAAYARRVALSRARADLKSGVLSIKQISHAAGYNHIGNFTRAYRQEFGENPSQTRRDFAAE